MSGSTPGKLEAVNTMNYCVSAECPCDWMCVCCIDRYDIKGCEVSRWTEPAPEGSQIIVVLKDLNFEGQFITLRKDNYALFWSLTFNTVQMDTIVLDE